MDLYTVGVPSLLMTRINPKSGGTLDNIEPLIPETSSIIDNLREISKGNPELEAQIYNEWSRGFQSAKDDFLKNQGFVTRLICFMTSETGQVIDKKCSTEILNILKQRYHPENI